MIITHRRDVGDGTTIRSVSPLPLHVVNGQLGRLEGHALQEVEVPAASHFVCFQNVFRSKKFANYIELF
jgi:hypothetical protein